MTTLTASPTPISWPSLAAVPSGLRARLGPQLSRRLFLAATRHAGISVGATRGHDIVLHRPEEFHARLAADGLIGFGEAYLTRAWDADDLVGVLTRLCVDIDALVPAWMQRLRAAYVARPPAHQRSDEHNARSNIAHHYDLSNDLFELFLDPTMSYSAGLFEGRERSLEVAQVAKFERILDRAEVGPHTRLLEIGTGWGELCIRAARRGATVVSVTLSQEQQALARRRIADEGLSHLVSVELLDYRSITGTYDAIVSVEMIEAVGHEFWATYFTKLDELLAPEGRVAIQAITMPHARMLATRSTYTWINKYIFPGGFLPSTEAINEITRDHTSLRVVERYCFGADYAETLRQWDQRFLAARDRVLSLGFDETFIRMWHFYLAYSGAGFASGYLDVQQIVMRRESR